MKLKFWHIIAKRWFEILLIISFAITLFGCASSKTKTRKQTDTETQRDISEKEVKRETRAGDTLTYTILNPKLKDTTIYIVNKEKVGSNRLRITYDSQGKQQIECMSDKIDVLTETMRTIVENESKQETTDTKEKDGLIKPIFFLYTFLGLAFLMIINKVANKFF